MNLFAHTPPPEAPDSPWHDLSAHLLGCSKKAAANLANCGQGEWGSVAGYLHDLGKATPEWQAYLHACVAEPGKAHPKVDHKLSGALLAQRECGAHGLPIVMAIAGHHGGLHDLEWLQPKLREEDREARLSRALENLPVSCAFPSLPKWIGLSRDKARTKEALEFFTRLLFSALVDGDFLDTEAYYAACGQEGSRLALEARQQAPPLATYLPPLEAHLGSFPADTPVRSLRAEVLDACRKGSSGPRGAYSLTVPTGGGKTLSSLAWALHHAQEHNLRRVIVALPFTTIIEQTAKVFREAFESLGPHAVLEHHSNLDPARETPQSRVASENWDASLIVTTQVQLFQSLFSNRPSACRKLHALQDAVLILDEVQSLPRSLLAPMLSVLNDLVANYGVSLLLMTATQPSLAARSTAQGPFPGLEPAPRELIPAPLAPRLWEGLRRVETFWPQAWEAPEPQTPGFWEALGARVLEHRAALAICHLKGDAQALFEALQRQDPEALHLSAAMCPAHRRATLQEVFRRLKTEEPCRLVSTQVVEAGVDLDFPVVFRAMAGLESLAQSAGRCNREGLLEAPGRFFVFEAPTQPPGVLREHLAVARSLLLINSGLDLFNPATFPTYFRGLHEVSPASLDALGIQVLRQGLRFQAVNDTFRMIPEVTSPIFIPWDTTARRLLERLRHAGPSRGVLRALQPYTVAVYERAFRELQQQGALDLVAEGFQALHQAPGPHYHAAMGFRAAADATTLLMA